LFLLASVGAGALAGGLVPPPAQAQTAPRPDLRPAVDDEAGPWQRAPKPSEADPEPRRKPPRYATPPGSGAGDSGFVSTNRPRPNRLTRGPRRPGAPAPLLLTAPGAAKPAAASATAPGSRTAPTARKQPPGTAVVGTAPLPSRQTTVLRRRVVEEDPYAPLGIRLGSFVLRPAIEVFGGYDSNPGRTTPARGSALVTVAPELELRSDWRRHELVAVLRGSYTTYGSASSLNRPNLEARAAGRIDVTRDTRVDLEGRYLIATDNPASPDLPAGLARLPISTAIGGTAGIAQRFNRLELSLRGSVDRVSYQDSTLTDGSTISNRDRDYNQYASALRASYELTPGMKPFVEAGVDRRVHDSEIDSFGFRRDSNGATVRAGTTFEISRKLTGEISVGQIVRTYRDPALPELRGVIADGALLWAATPLTTVRLTAKSGADESTLPGVSGVLRRDAGLQVDHAFRRWLIGTARLGYGLDTYEGFGREDTRYLASLGLTYKLTRTLQIKGELRQEWLRSNQPGNDYTASIALLGLRLQR
jgi:hypothetical protein